jgi:4-alpha-methyl-delta7-sterol-4alpha-methyl oxidase
MDIQEMIQHWLATYQDPRFVPVLIVTQAISMGAFLLFALPMTWIAARDPAWARRWKIQNTRGVGRLDEAEAARRNILVPGRLMVLASLRSWSINNVCMAIASLALWPLIALSGIHTGPLPAIWVIAAQWLLFIYLDDFLYYWMHRTMHRRFLLKHVHGWHHRVLAPWAITGHYMHPIEYMLTGTLAFLGPTLLGSHVVVLWLWIAFRQWEASEGHCGYDFPWTFTHLLPFSDGALHHDFHHARVRGNYAGFLWLWDRVFGTYVRDYQRDREAWRIQAQAKEVTP